MEESLISVVIPTYKRPPPMVKRALESVINQSYKNIEIIVVDDSPADFAERGAVEATIKSLNDRRVSYIKHEQNMGGCAARNTGIEASRGKFIAFLDDDDEWLPEKLHKQMAKMTGPSIGIVYCGYKIFDATTQTTRLIPGQNLVGSVFDDLILSNFIGSTSFVLVRRECFEECGLFDTAMRSSQDHDMWLRISLKYQVNFVDEPLVIYYAHDGERISTNPESKLQGIQAINKKYEDYLNTHRKAKSVRLMMLTPFYLLLGDRRKTIAIYWQSVKLAPFAVKRNLAYLKYIAKFFFSVKH
ncbi:glycosyltransferase family 2 protein [Desulfoscipio gibsoniae]|uniref:Glycosyl transferase n=1 Tax=Desulfoscipio gibsoniae DSM 7213 TaxID=767817 RepID=R4KPA4_9FIRM|nr:glycosyltransferase family 2 protein [Desulfoscipio gibsoniae]AGL03392.1 glycosyl transferase [Desulfoscipio gibsoniae DSM 7213]